MPTRSQSPVRSHSPPYLAPLPALPVMRAVLPVVLLLALMALGACRPSSEPVEAPADTLAVAPLLDADLGKIAAVFDSVPGAFVVVDTSREDTLFYGDVHVRSLPASTYKIPHTLLALTLGRDTSAAFAYDAGRDPQQPWWPDDWAEDQTLASAFRRSAVWAYQDLARQIGRDTAQAWLDSLAYGNHTLGPNVDRYWLDGSLQISPAEQVRFLDRLFAHELPATPSQHDALIRLMRLRTGPDWTIYGKTGTSGPEVNERVSWLVGAVRVGTTADTGGFVYPFALRIRPRESRDADLWSREERLARVERLLRAAGGIGAAR